jgi:hypothetical protein
VHGEPSLGADTGAVQGTRDGEVDRDAGLHVAGTPPVQNPTLDVCRERLSAGPVRKVADRHHVDVTLEHQPRHSVPGCRADDTVPLDPRRLRARELRVGPQLVEVERPEVDLQPGLLEPPGDGVLEVGLRVGPRDARDPDELDEGGDELRLVEGFEHAPLGAGRHGEVGARHARHCMPGPPCPAG